MPSPSSTQQIKNSITNPASLPNDKIYFHQNTRTDQLWTETSQLNAPKANGTRLTNLADNYAPASSNRYTQQSNITQTQSYLPKLTC